MEGQEVQALEHTLNSVIIIPLFLLFQFVHVNSPHEKYCVISGNIWF